MKWGRRTEPACAKVLRQGAEAGGQGGLEGAAAAPGPSSERSSGEGLFMFFSGLKLLSQRTVSWIWFPQNLIFTGRCCACPCLAGVLSQTISSGYILSRVVREEAETGRDCSCPLSAFLPHNYSLCPHTGSTAPSPWQSRINAMDEPQREQPSVRPASAGTVALGNHWTGDVSAALKTDYWRPAAAFGLKVD